MFHDVYEIGFPFFKLIRCYMILGASDKDGKFVEIVMTL